MRVLALALACAVLPVAAQVKVPDNLPPLPDGGATCNEKRTHCLVNFADWMASEMALQIAAERLVRQDQELEGLRAALAREKASKVVRCAVVTPEGR